jgi:bifunctional DNase/RNase
MSSEFVEAVVDSVRISLTNAQRIIMLKQVDAERYLPIWIGPYEAESITIALQEIEVSRPQTHDLIRNILTAMDARLSRIEIISLKEDVYYGRLVIEAPEKVLQVDARPSDAIALAVRYHAPIQVVAAILEKAGIHPERDLLIDEILEESSANPGEPGAKSDDTKDASRLSVFEDFLEGLDIDDDEPSEDEPGPPEDELPPN